MTSLMDLSVSITANDQATSKIESISSGVLAKGVAMGNIMSGAVTKVIDLAGNAASAAIGFVGDAVEVGKTFDASMSQVAATMGVTTDEIKDLRDFAQEMGATTAFSATQAADALNYMALAGYDAETSMNMLPTVLNLAAAGNIELATASDMVTDAQSALGLSLEETTMMVDQMAKASSKSNTSVQQLGEAYLTVGGTAKNLKGGTEELSTALGILADNGVKGAEGGTALRNIILSLSAPTKKAAGELQALGINVFDAEGNMRGLDDIMRQFDDAMSSLSQQEKTQALNTIFNKVDLKSVNALMSAATGNINAMSDALVATGYNFDALNYDFEVSGDKAYDMAWFIQTCFEESGGSISSVAKIVSNEFGVSMEDATAIVETAANAAESSTDRFSELAEAIADSGGAAEEMAKTQLDNLMGDMTLLQSAVEGFQIALADELTPSLREMTQTAADGFSQMKAAITEGDITAAGEAFGNMVAGILQIVLEQLPQWVDMGMKFLFGFIQGFAQALPEIIPSIVEMLTQMLQVFIENIPLVIETALQIIQGLVLGLIEAIPVLVEAVPQIIDALTTAFIDSIDLIIECGVQLLTALIENLPTIIANIVAVMPQIITALVNFFTQSIPTIIQAGVTLLVALVQNLPLIIQSIISVMPQIINSIVQTLTSLIPQLIQCGVTLLVSLIKNLPQAIATIVASLPQIITAMVNGIKGLIPRMVQAGADLLWGLATGIANAVGGVISSVIDAVGGIVSSVLGFFGIASPSKVFAGIGDYLMQGLEKGIEDNADLPLEAMEDVVESVNGAATMKATVKGIDAQATAGKSFVFNVTVNNEGQAKDAGRTIAQSLFNEMQRRELNYA